LEGAVAVPGISHAFPSSLQLQRALEKALETRLQALSAQEKALERRLSAVEGSVPGRTPGGAFSSSQDAISIEQIWDISPKTTVQGGSLRTWSFANPNIDRVHVLLKTDGRPLDADLEVWQGPDNTPQKMKIYVEDGAARTFSAFIDTPRSPNTVAIRNIGHLEFPLYACVGADRQVGEACHQIEKTSKHEIIQGGALRTYPYDPTVDSVMVFLKTDGRPLNARIELLQGPNNNKQVLELYTEDGMELPFCAVIQTPGSGNVVRIVNTAPLEFPLTATVAAYEVNTRGAWDEEGVMVGHSW
jgi:hypothetical protein